MTNTNKSYCGSIHFSWICATDMLSLCRVRAVYVPSQWETTLHYNDGPHWLGAYTISSLLIDLLCCQNTCSIIANFPAYQLKKWHNMYTPAMYVYIYIYIYIYKRVDKSVYYTQITNLITRPFDLTELSLWISQIYLRTQKHRCSAFLGYLVNENMSSSFIFVIFLVKCIIKQVYNYIHAGRTSSEIIWCMRPDNERRRYIITSSPIGWAHTQNNPCIFRHVFCEFKYFNVLAISIMVISKSHCGWRG